VLERAAVSENAVSAPGCAPQSAINSHAGHKMLFGNSR